MTDALVDTGILLMFGLVTSKIFSPVLPKVGPGRALGLLLRSYWGIKHDPLTKPLQFSARHQELSRINEFLQKPSGVKEDWTKNVKKSQYSKLLIVAGDTGLGKTCLIETALSQSPPRGFVLSSFYRTRSVEWLTRPMLTRLTDYNLRFGLGVSTRNVVFWHRLLTGGQPPLLVLRIEDNPKHHWKNYLKAARILTEEYNLKVIFETSCALRRRTTLNQWGVEIIRLEPFASADSIWAMPEFSALSKGFQKYDLAHLAWELLGGNPRYYVNLTYQLETALERATKKRKGHVTDPEKEILEKLLLGEIHKAVSCLEESFDIDSLEMQSFFDEFALGRVSLGRLTAIRQSVWKKYIKDEDFRPSPSHGINAHSPTLRTLEFVLRHRLLARPSSMSELLLMTCPPTPLE